MSLNPDQLFEAWGQIIADLFGKDAFRSDPITPDEWQKLDERWTALRQMNQKKEKSQ